MPIIGGSGVGAAAGDADVAGEHEGQVDRAVVEGRVEPVVDAFTLVNRDRLDGRDVFRELHNQVLRRGRHLAHAVHIVVLEVNLVEVPGGRDLDFLAIRELHAAFEIQLRIKARLPQRLAHHVTRECLG